MALAILALVGIGIGSLLPAGPEYVRRLPAVLPDHHLMGYTAAGLLLGIGLSARIGMTLGIIAALTVYGALIELAQELAPNRGADIRDFWLNVAGASLGSVTAWAIGSWWRWWSP